MQILTKVKNKLSTFFDKFKNSHKETLVVAISPLQLLNLSAGLFIAIADDLVSYQIGRFQTKLFSSKISLSLLGLFAQHFIDFHLLTANNKKKNCLIPINNDLIWIV